MRCAFCSPNSPKFVHGILFWSPKDGLLRAFGRTCGANHFGQYRFNEMQRLHRRQLQHEQAVEFLLQQMPYVSKWLSHLSHMQPLLERADDARRRLKKETPILERHLRGAADNHDGTLNATQEVFQLSIEDVSRRENDDDTEGSQQLGRKVAVQEVVWRLRGKEFLQSTGNLAKQGKSFASTLDAYSAHSCDDDDILGFLGRIELEGQTFPAASTLWRTIQGIKRLENQLQNYYRFFSAENATGINVWLARTSLLSGCRGRMMTRSWWSITDNGAEWFRHKVYEGSPLLGAPATPETNFRLAG